MAECPLPKPNTRVRFPSPAPKEEGVPNGTPSSFGIVDAFQNRVRAKHARGEFAEQICATIAYNRGLVLIPVTAWVFLLEADDGL